MIQSLLSRGAIMAFLNSAVNPDQRGGTWPTFQIEPDSHQPPTLTVERWLHGNHVRLRRVIIVGQWWLVNQLETEVQRFVDGQ